METPVFNLFLRRASAIGFRLGCLTTRKGVDAVRKDA
jgi:hypothetical protein